MVLGKRFLNSPRRDQTPKDEVPPGRIHYPPCVFVSQPTGHVANILASRQSLKKYVRANNTINVTTEKMFDSLFNKALKNGVDKGVFEQPKGMWQASHTIHPLMI